jgi:hypothetical protein
MLSELTERKRCLLQLPIVLSEPAWLQSVYIKDFLFAEMKDRLNSVLDASYRALLAAPDVADVTHFDLWLFPASGEREELVRMVLCLYVQYVDEQPSLLRVLLNDEEVWRR